MFVIENGFTYIAFLMFLCGGLLALQKYAKWKIFDIVPPLVLMLLRCDFKKIAKLGGRLIAIFLGCSLTLAIGFIVFYPILKGAMGGGEKTWAATAALFASWVGGSANMAAMEANFEGLIDPGAYGCALALDTVCYKGQKKATSADWIFLIGLSLGVSVIAQKAGVFMNNGFKSVGLAMFDKGTCTTVFVTVLGLICAMSPLGKLPAVEELSSVLLYAVVAMLASQAPLNALLEAPMWVVYGMLVLVVHVVLMFLLSKIFHWDLCMVSTASVANMGGAASAPIIACAYSDSFAGIGVLMGVLGAAIGNFMGMGMGAILRMLA